VRKWGKKMKKITAVVFAAIMAVSCNTGMSDGGYINTVKEFL
jgi:hypothetical protein